MENRTSSAVRSERSVTPVTGYYHEKPTKAPTTKEEKALVQYGLK